jgi:chromosome partitioning protein
MAVIALYNIKGGVGKTAGTVNLAYCAAQQGKKTLIIDLDPQSASSYYFKVKPKKKYNEQRLLDGGTGVDKNIRGTDYENLDLLPADFSYRNLDLSIDDRKKSQNRLRKVISPLRKQYEHIFIDCPPNITLVAENVFRSADIILTPVIPTTLSARTLSQLVDFLKLEKITAAKLLSYFSMVEMRKNLHKTMMESLDENFAFLSTRVPYQSAVEKMGIERRPVAAFAPRSVAAQRFLSLWEELQINIATL